MRLIDNKFSASSGRNFKTLLSYPIFQVVRNGEPKTIVIPKDKKKMCCPFCGEPLEQLSKPERIQDCCEHASNPNGIPSYKRVGVCVNMECEFTDLFKWTLHDGGCCYRDYFEILYNRVPGPSSDPRDYTLEFKPGMERLYELTKNYYHSALNSFSRRSDIEIYKTGLTEEIRLTPLLALGIFRPVIKVDYSSNESGNILKTVYKLDKIRYNKEDGKYNISHPGFFHMFKYEVGKLSRGYKRKKMDKKLYHKVFIVHKDTFPDETKAWWVCAKYYMRVIHPLSYFKYRKTYGTAIEDYKSYEDC